MTDDRALASSEHTSIHARLLPAARYDEISLSCASSLPVTTVESSRTLGWKSLLLDHQLVRSAEDDFETLATPDHTIVIMTKGRQELQTCVRGRWSKQIYSPGSVGITPGGVTERLRRRVNLDYGPASKINCYIPPIVFEEAAEHLGVDSMARLWGLVETTRVDHALRSASMTLLEALRAGAPSLYADTMSYWIAVHLMTSRQGSLDAARLSNTGLRDKRLKRVIEYMDSHFNEDLSLDKLASVAAVSKFHFARLFRGATGLTPHQWLVDRRLEAGRMLMISSDSSVAEVALLCGFKRANYFAKAFGTRFGISPLAYRLRR